MSNSRNPYADAHRNASNSNLLPTHLTSPDPRGRQLQPPSPSTARSANGLMNHQNASSSSVNSQRKKFYGQDASSRTNFMSEKFSLGADPAAWGADVNRPEPDDALHNPDPKRDLRNDTDVNICTGRGFMNIGCLLILVLGITTLFAGFPIISYVKKAQENKKAGLNLGNGVNATGQVPIISGNFALIDPDTPKEMHTIKSYHDPTADMQLVFSDEFNRDGRTFYPGDDPFWEAVDLHYWVTGNQEWYDPQQITTKNGSLHVKLSKIANPSINVNHGLNYTGGMVSTWNKFCFTGGIVQASVRLPGPNNVQGLWPAVWTMGNLGRAGYAATTDGTWPYSYDSCDVGTLRNQTYPGTRTPEVAWTSGDPAKGGQLSALPGQRLSRCTCPGESHPGPVHKDGTYVGRSAPEIDVFEAQMNGAAGHRSGAVSQSGQWAPFNKAWKYNNATTVIVDPTISKPNGYNGSPYQQASSVVSDTNQDCYEEGGTNCFSIYAYEYKTGFDDAYISWITDNKLVWTVNQAGLGPDPDTEIGTRVVPREPMYLIINLGQSTAFTNPIEVDLIPYPVSLLIDWIRVYQPADSINIGCNPPDFPTTEYINTYIEAYTNPNLTVWGERLGPDQVPFHQPWPKNNLTTPGGC